MGFYRVYYYNTKTPGIKTTIVHAWDVEDAEREFNAYRQPGDIIESILETYP